MTQHGSVSHQSGKGLFPIEKIQWVNIFFSGLLDRLD
jgi:hypothetical protein